MPRHQQERRLKGGPAFAAAIISTGTVRRAGYVGTSNRLRLTSHRMAGVGGIAAIYSVEVAHLVGHAYAHCCSEQRSGRFRGVSDAAPRLTFAAPASAGHWCRLAPSVADCLNQSCMIHGSVL